MRLQAEVKLSPTTNQPTPGQTRGSAPTFQNNDCIRKWNINWKEFKDSAPDLAALGHKLLHGKIAFLATSRKDGSPRLHPVRPFIGKECLYLFIDRKSPKRQDLLHDGRCALHSSVFQENGPSTEFLITGVAAPAGEPGIRQEAFRVVGHDLPDQQALFILTADRVLATEYDSNRKPIRSRWTRPAP